MQMLFSFLFSFMLYFAGIMQAEVFFFLMKKKNQFKDLWHSYNSLNFFSTTCCNAILIPHKATMLYS